MTDLTDQPNIAEAPEAPPAEPEKTNLRAFEVSCGIARTFLVRVQAISTEEAEHFAERLFDNFGTSHFKHIDDEWLCADAEEM